MDVPYREWIEKTASGWASEGGAEDGRTPSWYVPDARPLPSAAQAFVVDSPDHGGVAGSFHAVVYQKQFWPGGIPVLRVARILPNRKSWDGAAVLDVVVGIKALARSLRMSLIELEVCKSVWKPVYYPSSPTAINACNDPELAVFLGREKVPFRDVLSTVEVPLEAAGLAGEAATGAGVDGAPGRHGRSRPGPEITVRFIRQDDPADRDAYYRLWSESGDLPVSLAGSVRKAAPQVADWRALRPWYTDVSTLLSRDEYILLAEAGGQPVGFAHWWPNVYRIRAEHGPGGLHVPAEGVSALVRQTAEGKVFKLVVDKKAASAEPAVSEALLRETFRVMREDFGLRKAHVAGLRLYPKGADLPVGGALNRLSGRAAEVVQEVVLYNFKP